MSSATQFSIYNGALRALGQTKLATPDEPREARYDLDEVWEENGIKACLEMGLWNFAMKTVQATPDNSIEPDFGFTLAYEKPSDWVRTAAFCQDEYFSEPNFAYTDEGDYWFCDLNPAYIKYVSDDAAYGLDFAKWPESFRKFVYYYFADEIKAKILKSEKLITAFEKKFEKVRTTAKSRDAMNEPSRFAATGSFVRSRRGGSSG